MEGLRPLLIFLGDVMPHSTYDDTPASPATSIGDLRKRIKYRLGWPQTKLEVKTDQIDEQIRYSIKKFHKHALGLATKRQFLVFWLIPGQTLYTLPVEVNRLFDWQLDTSLTGINTLFTLENYLWNYGFLNFLDFQSGQFTLLSYHLVLDYIETLRRYVSGKYRFQFNEWTRQLIVEPEPDTTELAMIHVETKVDEEYLYDSDWVEDYATAKTKLIIGEIRSKFSGATLPGIGATLNGPELKQEAMEAIKDLELQLKMEESDGWKIYWG